MVIVDTHCHLDFEQFDCDRSAVIERAERNGVVGYILIGIDPPGWESTRQLAGTYENMWRTAGLHPNSVAKYWNAELESALRDEIAAGGIVGIGETGVDLFRSDENRKEQMEAFDIQVGLARSSGLPVAIHQRNAEAEVLEVLARHGVVAGVMHCFGGDWDFARRCLDHGLHLGIGGVATYKSAAATRDAINRAPENRLLLETDAPFLAPQGQRGRRNEPAFLPTVVETIAKCRGISAGQVEEITTQNASSLFGLGL
ncbi:TatD family hydrolase [soil metagenome]